MQVKAYKKASITVEAALILPIFICFFLVFMYFFQIFLVQEHIQSAITKTGLELAKGCYLFDDFVDVEEALDFDTDFLDFQWDQELKNFARATTEGFLLKQIAQKHLDVALIDNSCIKAGFEGLSFYGSSLLGHEDSIDIIVSYNVEIPIDIFAIGDIPMIQRIKLRGWTGHKVPAKYLIEDEESKKDGTIVYVTKTGSAYHLKKSCSHISFSIEEVYGIPNSKRNNSGAKYYPCSTCCKGHSGDNINYYITAYGTRYHVKKECSRIERNVEGVLLSELKGKTLCKRCKKNSN